MELENTSFQGDARKSHHRLEADATRTENPETAADEEHGESRDGQERRASSERLEARAFSKEHSQFHRDRLARQIWDDRARLATLLEDKTRTIDRLTSSREESLGYLKERLAEKRRQVELHEGFEAFQREVKELEEEVETIKTGFWRRLTRKDRLIELESRLSELQQDGPAEAPPLHGATISDLKDEMRSLKSRLEEAENEPLTAESIAEIRESMLFFQDDAIIRSKNLITEFYSKNLDIKRSLVEDPGARDVAEISRRHGVLLRHGVPSPFRADIEGDAATWAENNGSIDSAGLDPQSRMLFAAAVQPCLSTHTEAPAGAKFFAQGLLVTGGEVLAAHKSDLFTYANDLDMRIPKDDNGQVSSFMPDIGDSVARAIHDAGTMNERPWNEIVVRHPRFSAVYVKDAGEWGQFSDGGYYDKFHAKAVWALEQAANLGIPAVVILESGKMINIATGEEVTNEELLDETVQYSPEEREPLLDKTGYESHVRDIGVSESMAERLAALGADASGNLEAEGRKRRNIELARRKIEALEAERRAAAERIRKDFSTK